MICKVIADNSVEVRLYYALETEDQLILVGSAYQEERYKNGKVKPNSNWCVSIYTKSQYGLNTALKKEGIKTKLEAYKILLAELSSIFQVSNLEPLVRIVNNLSN
jgi:hypothetical protein